MLSSVLRRLSFVVCSAFAFSSANAIEPINVLVALTPDSSNHATPTTLAARYENAMAVASSETGMVGRTVAFHPYPAQTTFVGDSLSTFHPSQALDFLVDGTDTDLVAAREGMLGVDGFDLVLMVVDGFDDSSICGGATRPTNFSSNANSEENAFLVIDVNEVCSTDLVSFVVPHEVGHILGGEHQADGFGGVNPDTSPQDPVSYNHPVFTSSAYTLLASPGSVELNKAHLQFSKAYSGNLPGTSIPAGSAFDRDNYRLFTQTTWSMVSAYRPQLPPGNPPHKIKLQPAYASDGDLMAFIRFFRNSGHLETNSDSAVTGTNPIGIISHSGGSGLFNGEWSNYAGSGACCLPSLVLDGDPGAPWEKIGDAYEVRCVSGGPWQTRPVGSGQDGVGEWVSIGGSGTAKVWGIVSPGEVSGVFQIRRAGGDGTILASTTFTATVH